VYLKSVSQEDAKNKSKLGAMVIPPYLGFLELGSGISSVPDAFKT
jgi:hypothetical protein